MFSLKLITLFTYSSVLLYWLMLLENGNKIIFTTVIYLQLAKEACIGKVNKVMQDLSNCIPVATAYHDLFDMRVVIEIPG